MQKFLAGVGRALIFKNNNLIGVARTLTDSTLDFAITGEEIRGGVANTLWGKYFHDSSLNVTLTDAMFNLEYMAAALGVDIESGGLSVQEEELTIATPGTATITKTPVAFEGTLIGWYRNVADASDMWQIGTIAGKQMSIPSSTAGQKYCVKYFYQNADARQITINTQYVPSELHVTIINDLWAGDIASGTTGGANKIGKLITDIPRLQMDGSQNLALTSTGAATVSLSGSALANIAGASCEDETYFGTMTEQIDSETWQSRVIALAIENSEIEIGKNESETLIVRAVYGGAMASNRIDNSALTFTSSAEGTATVEANTGKVTGGSTSGKAYITVALTGYENVDAATAVVTVS
nr:MAG TPA: structural protein [Caudoviricetes sp.]